MKTVMEAVGSSVSGGHYGCSFPRSIMDKVGAEGLEPTTLRM